MLATRMLMAASVVSAEPPAAVTVALSTAASLPVSGLVSVTATFSEVVTGLTAGEIVVYNGAASNLATSDNLVWTFDVTPDLLNTVSVVIPAGVAVGAHTTNDASNWLHLPVPWWRRGSVSPAAAYSGHDAANYAASLADLTGNSHTLTSGGTLSWSAGRGWVFTGAGYLNTGIVASEGQTLVVAFKNSTAYTFLMGAYADPRGFGFSPETGSGPDEVQFWSGSYGLRSPKLVQGALAIAGAQPYRNGAADGAALSAWGGSISSPICLGAMGGYAGNYFSGDIRRAAVFGGTLTGAQAKAIMRAAYDYPVFFGDSVTAGSGASDAAHRWVNLVATDQDYDLFENAGIAGTVLQNTAQTSVSTIGNAADDNGRDTYAARVLAVFPERVFILYGLNDLRLNDAAFSTANFENDLAEIVNGLIADGVRRDQVYLGSPPYMSPSAYASYAPFDGGSTVKHAAYRDAVRAVADATGANFVDVYQAMLDGGDDALISGDGIHPNDAGHAVIASAFLAAM